MSEERYNGWRNYPTWNVALWINNEPYTQERAHELAREAVRRGASAMSSSPAALLADDLETYVGEWIDEQTEDSSGEPFGACMANDLLTWAVGQVDWYELAEAFLSDVAEEN